MSLVRLEKVAKSFAGEPVLNDVDFRIEEGERIGLIGRNGSGKTTLFRLITGELEPDSGVIERMRRLRCSHLVQLPRFESSQTVLDVALLRFETLIALETQLRDLEDHISAGVQGALAQYSTLHDLYARQGGYDFRHKVKRVLTGLGFQPDDFHLAASALSGGQRTRLMLALILLQETDLLLLDEPENHLDLAAREWLESFLGEWPKGVVVISHDRQLLNHVATRIVEIEQGRLHSHKGNYDAYVKHRAKQRETQRRAFVGQQLHIQKEQAWIDRFRYKKTKAAQVQSRIKRLEKLQRIEAHSTTPVKLRMNLGGVVRSGELALEVSDLSMSYGNLKLYEALSFRIERGERVGIVGPNGSGKTTLLRQLAGRIAPGNGTITLGHKTTVGFYEQHHEHLCQDNDILTEIRALRPDMTPQSIRSFLGRLLFTGDDVFKRIATLSGGELSRVAIAKLILSGANLVLLDEPTNHLDIASREALEEALEDFPGSMVLVSHDRALIDRFADKLIVMGNGQASVRLGNYSHYRWQLSGQVPMDAVKPSREALKIRHTTPKTQRKTVNEIRKLRRQLDDLERDIEAMEKTMAGFEARFAELSPSDRHGLIRLSEEYEGRRKDLQAMYAEWETLAEALHAASDDKAWKDAGRSEKGMAEAE